MNYWVNGVEPLPDCGITHDESGNLWLVKDGAQFLYVENGWAK